MQTGAYPELNQTSKIESFFAKIVNLTQEIRCTDSAWRII